MVISPASGSWGIKYQIFIQFCQNYSCGRLSTLPALLGSEQMTSSLLSSANITGQGNQRTAICFCGIRGSDREEDQLVLGPTGTGREGYSFSIVLLVFG